MKSYRHFDINVSKIELSYILLGLALTGSGVLLTTKCFSVISDNSIVNITFTPLFFVLGMMIIMAGLVFLKTRKRILQQISQTVRN